MPSTTRSSAAAIFPLHGGGPRQGGGERRAAGRRWTSHRDQTRPPTRRRQRLCNNLARGSRGFDDGAAESPLRRASAARAGVASRVRSRSPRRPTAGAPRDRGAGEVRRDGDRIGDARFRRRAGGHQRGGVRRDRQPGGGHGPVREAAPRAVAIVEQRAHEGHADGDQRDAGGGDQPRRDTERAEAREQGRERERDARRLDDQKPDDARMTQPPRPCACAASSGGRPCW